MNNSALDCVCLDYSSPIYNTELQKWVESSGAFVAWNGHRDVVTDSHHQKLVNFQIRFVGVLAESNMLS